MDNENDQHQHDQQQNSKTNGGAENISGNFKTVINGSCDDLDGSKETKSDGRLNLFMTSKENVNDLVADLCINVPRSSSQNPQALPNLAAYGDYKNIRATSGPVNLNESNSSNNSSTDFNNSIHSVQQQPPTQNSSFSFKHFLSSSNVPTAPSTTVTSLDPPVKSTSTTYSSSATTSSRSLQTSTGARPKVPQSNSASSNSISSLTVGNTSDTHISATKMKRSPRFSSFDSQASLAEYAGSSTGADLPQIENLVGSSTGRNDFNPYPEEKDRDRFQEWDLSSNGPTMTTNSSDYDRGRSNVPRSYSYYDMPRLQTSPRRRVGIIGTTKDTKPARLALNTNQNPTTAAKLKLDLPITSNSTGCGGTAATNRKTANCAWPADLSIANSLPGAAAAAAALPDFVQDHWMDSWYANEISSPPLSPVSTFVDDVTGERGADAIQTHKSGNGMPQLYNVPLPGPADRGDFPFCLPETSSSSVGSKMLPDFLSDGPIIHSSQRLADVAAGLPSNSSGSPEESSINNQLSHLRSENEQLRRDLNELRVALAEANVRANNFERLMIEQQSLHKTETEETLDTNRKRTTAAHTHVAKLKQQLHQLTAEVEMLRKEKESLREEGAVGGCSASSCDRSYKTTAVSSTTTNKSATTAPNKTTIGNSSNVHSVTSTTCGGALGMTPSKKYQLSKDLRRAASNAEQNLKQLLAGVENLRVMAANIENSDVRINYDASPDLFSDFQDECDDYDEYTGGGPAL